MAKGRLYTVKTKVCNNLLTERNMKENKDSKILKNHYKVKKDKCKKVTWHFFF